jgi:DNA repair protein RecN (Recombination protein N)
MDSKLSGVLDMLEEAAIQLSEASDELRHYVTVWISTRTVCSSLSSASPVRFRWRVNITSRRKSCRLLSGLLEEQQQLDDQADSLETLSGGESASSAGAGDSAKLHEIRQQRQELSQHITESMHSLAMPHGVFAIDVRFDENHLTAEGADRIEFRVTTNPGQPLQPSPKWPPAVNCRVLRWRFR